MSSTRASQASGPAERPDKFGVSSDLVAAACETHRTNTTGPALGTTYTLGQPPASPGPWDSLISLGELWHHDDLPSELARLAEQIHPGGRLYFCEPTGHGPRQPGDPWDFTEQLWLAGWTPVDLHRFEAKSRGVALHFVRGAARLTLGRDRAPMAT